MHNAEERELNETVQEKYHKYIKKYAEGVSVPEQKFIDDAVYGIVSSKSCILRRVSQGLREKISLKKTGKRLSYHLSKEHIHEHISERVLSLQGKKMDDETVIICDPGDILKKYAQKMEGLSSVRDGSTGE